MRRLRCSLKQMLSSCSCCCFVLAATPAAVFLPFAAHAGGLASRGPLDFLNAGGSQLVPCRSLPSVCYRDRAVAAAAAAATAAAAAAAAARH